MSLLTRILEVPSSNIGRDVEFPNRSFCSFYHPLQTKAVIVLVRPGPLASQSFPVRCCSHPVVRRHIVLITTASLNKLQMQIQVHVSLYVHVYTVAYPSVVGCTWKSNSRFKKNIFCKLFLVPFLLLPPFSLF
jgi:hypothetical protein